MTGERKLHYVGVSMEGLILTLPQETAWERFLSVPLIVSFSSGNLDGVDCIRTSDGKRCFNYGKL